MAHTLLIVIGMVAASIWVGSLVCLAIVSAAATATLDGASRVALFRGVGRRYGVVGMTSLIVAIGVGLVLAAPVRDFTSTEVAVFLLAGLLVVATIAGMLQARWMSVQRRRLVAAPGNEAIGRAVQRGAIRAQVLRGSLATITLVIVVLVATVIDS